MDTIDDNGSSDKIEPNFKDWIIKKEHIFSECICMKNKKLTSRNLFTNKTYSLVMNKNIPNSEMVYFQCNDEMRYLNKKGVFISTKPLCKFDILPINKIILNNSELFHFPQKRINVLFFSKYFHNLNDNKFNFIKYLKERKIKFKSIICVENTELFKSNLTDFNMFSDNKKYIYTVNSYDRSILTLYRLFNFEHNDDYSFIIYDNKFRLIEKGSHLNNDLNIEKCNLIFYSDKKSTLNIININELKISKEESLSLMLNNNLINDEARYKAMKNHIKTLTKSHFREKCESLKQVVISIKLLKTITVNEKRFIKEHFKTNLEYNHVATMKNKTGAILDNFISKFSDLIYTDKIKNDELKQYLKISKNYLNDIMKVCGINNMVYTFTKIQKLGMVKYHVKYIIKNKTPLVNYITPVEYFNNITSQLNYYSTDNKCSEELKNKVNITSVYHGDNYNRNAKFKINYFNEKLEEKEYIAKAEENKVSLFLIVTVFNNYYFDLYSNIFPLLEKFKKEKPEFEHVHIEVYLIMFAEYEEIQAKWISKTVQEFLNYTHNQCNLMFLPPDQVTQLLRYVALDNLINLCLTPDGKLHSIETSELNEIDTFLWKVLTGDYIRNNYSITKDQYKDLKFYAEKLMRINIPNLSYQPIFYLSFKKIYEFSYDFDVDYEKEVKYFVSIFLKARANDIQYIMPFTRKIKQLLLLHEELKMHRESIQTFDIPLGKICSKCGDDKLGLKIPHYYCYFCDIHFCQKCGDKYNQSSKTLKDKLPHEHYLVYINVENEMGMKNIEVYKFGYNIFHKYNTGEDVNYQAHYVCGVCYKNIFTPKRFICISCRPGAYRQSSEIENAGFMDICEECFLKLQHNNIIDPQHKKELENEKHDNSSHVYLRVDYTNGNYSCI
jgi:hypothetical protein